MISKLQGRLLATTVLVGMSVFESSALAQCVPDSASANVLVNCTGVDSDGVTISATGTDLRVATGATVLSRPDLAGSIVLQGPAGASILANLSNEGTISAATGVAIGSIGNSGSQSFISIVNGQNATISGSNGAISAIIGRLDNAGVINGGSGSAIDLGTVFSFNSVQDITNTGSITSSGPAATIANLGYASFGAIKTVVNNGSITNGGPGTAISGRSMTVANGPDGTIGTGGVIAILATEQLALTNRGTINGDVAVTIPGQYFLGATVIDSVGGTVNGRLLLGESDDYLIATYTGSPTLSTGFTGSINGGGGTDTVSVRFTGDGAIDTPINRPTNFERLAIAPENGATVTLGTGFTNNGTLVLQGTGTVINRATLSSPAEVLVGGLSGQSIGQGLFVNEGVITSSSFSNNVYAADFTSLGNFTNKGTISSSGGGIRSSYMTLVNSGLITANGTGANQFAGRVENSGTIRSIFGTAVSGSIVNTGLITGVVGADSSNASIINSGTIEGSTTGVQLSATVLENRAGGLIQGGTRGLGGYAGSSFILQSSIVNSGTIRGTVDMATGVPTGFFTQNLYISAGGVLEGDLRLGRGDVFVTDFADLEPGRYAGVTGTVSALSARLVYRISGEATGVAKADPTFISTSYDLFGNAKLTLTRGATLSQVLQLAGNGSADVTADIQTTETSALAETSVTMVNGTTNPDTAKDGLTVVSRGALSFARSGFTSAPSTVFLTSANFTNAGTIAAVDRAPQGGDTLAAIQGGKTVTNSGTISLDGAIGARSMTEFINSGAISQALGGRLSQGVLSVARVTNSGVIDLGGVGVALSFNGMLQNSGQILSRSDTAIVASNGRIDNLTGGVITGAADKPAITLSNSTLSNAGTINGNVIGSGTYIDNGGTLNGDLRFGSGADIFLATGAMPGVTGVIDGGAGRDIFGRILSSSGSVSLDAFPVVNFEDFLIIARGENTQITLTSTDIFANTVYAVGNGAVINQATISGAVSTYPFAVGDVVTATDGPLASFVNSGLIGGGIAGQMTSLSNNGTIGRADLTRSAVQINNAGTATLFNTGTIFARQSSSLFSSVYAVQLRGMDNATLINSGRIEGGASIIAQFFDASQAHTARVTNSGAIVTTPSNSVIARALVLSGSSLPGQNGELVIVNSGTISATASAYAYGVTISDSDPDQAPSSYALTNSGSITATVASGTALGLFVTGRGTSTIANAAGGEIRASGLDTMAIGIAGGALDLTNAGTIAAIGVNSSIAIGVSQGNADMIHNTGRIIGKIDLDAGDDRIENYGTIRGNVTLGAGKDTFVQLASGIMDGIVDGGDDIDTFIADSTNGGSIDANRFVNFELFGQIGTGSMNYSGAFAVQTVQIDNSTASVLQGATLSSAGSIALTGGDGAERVTNAGTISGDISLGGGNDSVENLGTINGSVALGAGDDVFLRGAGGVVTGQVDGSTGYDRLQIAFAGTDASPSRLDTDGFINFDALDVQSGVATYSDAVRFDAITVQNGRLIGLANSNLSGNVVVNGGGTFGSAGAIDGNVTVNAGGTLSPGASPGIMTINGNLVIGNGTTTTFEFVPNGQSDQIIVNGGSVTIGTGTTINLTGSLTPGASRDLVIVNGGGTISGAFATVNRDPGIVGVLRYNATVLQLMGIFTAPSNISVQAQAGVDYVNGLLTAGTASDTLVNAVPSLMSGGTANAAAFGLITGEAYASASQFGVQRGLALVDAGRGGLGVTHLEEAGLFGFAQSFGDWRRLSDPRGVGASKASGQVYGTLGGMGFGTARASVAAFVGFSDGRQTIGSLGARTDADGVVAGITGHFASGGFSLTGSLAYDGSEARTRRAVPGGATVFSGRYRLHNWVADAVAAYELPLSSTWAIRPELGFTHIATLRGPTIESGSPAFALAVDRTRSEASFIDGTLKLKAQIGTSSVIRPWLQAGIRHQFSGRISEASAGFVGNTVRFTVLGASRRNTVGSAGVGADVSLSAGLRLFGVYRAEPGRGASHNATVGLVLGL